MNGIDGVDWNLWPVLAHLLETGSVTETARRLGRTQSAVSHSLTALRAALRDPLFVRVGPRFEATPRARELQGTVRELMRTVSLALTPRAFEPAKLERTFTLLLSDYVQVVLLPPLMARLAREAPGVRLDVHFRSNAMLENLAEVAAGRLDATVAPQLDAPAGVVRSRLFDDVNVCVVRKRHPALSRWNAKRFAALPHVQVSPRQSGRDFVDEALAKEGLTRTTVVRVPHYATAPDLVRDSDAVAVVPARIAASWRRDVTVVRPPVPLPGFTMATYFPELLRADPAHTWFRKLLPVVVSAPRASC